jgi:hypothetical protein
MKLLAKQLVSGLHHPRVARGEHTMIGILPRKDNPPALPLDMGTKGWGLHAKRSFHVRKFLWWLVGVFLVNAVFVVLWLVCVSPTDLQNAFVPGTIVLAFFTLGLAVLQMYEK